MIHVVLKQAESGDEAFLYHLYASTRKEEIERWGWPQQAQEAFLAMQFQAQQKSYKLQYGDADQQIIMQDDNRVGRVITAHTGKTIILADISILPPYRNQGIGSTILHMLQDEARLCQIPIYLHVRMDNPAQFLYQRRGFLPVEKSELDMKMCWHPS